MENLFLGMLNRGLTASWLVLAVLVLRFALRRAPKWTRGALWALVALRLICPFSVESALSLIPSAEPIPQDILYEAHPRLHTGIAALNTATAPVMESAFAPSPTDSANPLQIWAIAGARLWLTGAATMLLYALASYLRLRRRVAASIPLEDNARLCDGIDSPFILGVFRPRVYVPSALSGEQLSHVLAHERAHLARRDHWWKPLGFVLLAVYWFNPALWLAYILLCRDVELACDERVYRNMALAERADYSQTLLEQSCSRARVAACPLAFGEVGVKERVKAALSYKKPAFWVLLVAVAACVVVAVCFLTDPVRKPEEGPEQIAAEDTPASSLDDFRRKVENARGIRYMPPATSSLFYPDAITDPELLAEVKSVLEQVAKTDTKPSKPDGMGWLFSGAFMLDEADTRKYYAAEGYLCEYDETSGETVVLGKMPEGVDLNRIVENAARRQEASSLPDTNRTELQVGVLIVQFDPKVLGTDELDALGKKYGFEALRSFGRSDLFSVHFDEPLTESRKKELLDALNGEKGILLAGELAEVRPAFWNLMGLDGYVARDSVSRGIGVFFYTNRYYAVIDGESWKIAESFGLEMDDHTVDLDGDGTEELVCNCGGDGARRVFVYRRSGNVIERGSLDYDKLRMAAWNNWGANSTVERYDPERGVFLVDYASPASSRSDGMFTCEAGFEALVWEEYALLPD